MLTMKDIIREGHPTLRKKAVPVKLPLSEEDAKTLRAMRQFLIDSQDPEKAETYELRPGVGLAAPQINIPKRMVAIRTEDERFETLHDYCLINPRIVRHSVAKTYMPGGEGCLSVDRDVEGLVERHQHVTIEADVFNPENGDVEAKTLKLRGFLSIVIQHEIDHLDGILFYDKVTASLPDATPVRFINPNEDDDQTNQKPKEDQS